MKVLLQCGHNAAFPPFRANGGGAPGEAVWTGDVAVRLANRLRVAGVQVDIVGSWLSGGTLYPPPDEASRDYDLFVALHYDADVYAVRSGCFAGRATLDPLGAEADRAIVCWEAVYPAMTGIPLHRERNNENVRNYYAFRDTTENTPGILIEHGVGQGLDHGCLFDQMELVVEADASAILAYLGVTPAEPEPEEDVGIIDELNSQIAELRQTIAERDSTIGALNEDVIKPLRAELEACKNQPPAEPPAEIESVSIVTRVRRTDGTMVVVPAAFEARV